MERLLIKPQTVSVRYIVSNVEACVEFYVEFHGFELVLNPPGGFAMLSKGNVRLLLNEAGAGGGGQAMPDGTVPEPGGWNRLQLQTNDIGSTIEYLKTMKARFRNDLVIGNGGKQILLMDPSGNLIELVEPNQDRRS